jgi:hypothetical protein
MFFLFLCDRIICVADTVDNMSLCCVNWAKKKQHDTNISSQAGKDGSSRGPMGYGNRPMTMSSSIHGTQKDRTDQSFCSWCQLLRSRKQKNYFDIWGPCSTAYIKQIKKNPQLVFIFEALRLWTKHEWKWKNIKSPMIFCWRRGI